jgi:hypothetical protein
MHAIGNCTAEFTAQCSAMQQQRRTLGPEIVTVESSASMKEILLTRVDR